MGDTERHAGPCIVVGHDGSEAARAAVRTAAARAGQRGRIVVVLSPDSPSERFMAGGTLSLLEDRFDHGQALLDELLMEEAEALTETVQADGRVGSLLGSVAQDVLHRAECPVLVIPKRAVDAHATSDGAKVATQR